MPLSRSRLVMSLAILSWAAACADDIPEVPQPGESTSGTAGDTQNITTFSTMPDPTSIDMTMTTATSVGTDDASSSDSSGVDTTAGGREASIYAIQDGTIGTGVAVTVRAVAVTAVTDDGLFVREADGGEYSGVFVRTGTPRVHAVGDEVDIVGTTDELAGRTEVDASAGSVVMTGTADPAGPDVVALADLAADAEPWEGVLIRVEGTPLDVVDVLVDAEFEVSDGQDSIVVDDLLHDVVALPRVYPGFAVSAEFTAVQGPLDYSDDRFKIIPRGADDLDGYMPPEIPAAGVDDLVPGDLVITEVMFDPTCPADVCEWIEVYNASEGDVDLFGLRIQDSAAATEGVIAVSTVVADGDFAVLGRGSEVDWPYATMPTAFYGSGPFFNNSSGGDLVVVLNATEALDVTATYPVEAAADDGVSWKLHPGSLDAVSNDLELNWCFSTTVFDSPMGIDEYGSPGVLNEAACAIL